MTSESIHIVKEIRKHIASKPSHTAMRERHSSILTNNASSAWSSITWGEFGDQMDQLSLALLASDVKIQEKIGIFSNNMPRWTVADFATMQLRAVPVPIYPTNTPTQAAYIINDADIRILFVGEQAQYNAAVVIFDQCPQLTQIVALSDDIDLNDHEAGVSWNNFVAKAHDDFNNELQSRIASAQMNDLLTLIYTSGTTGEPKGVMLDYDNIASQLEGHNTHLALSEKDVSLSFLPLSHVFERAWTFYVLYKGAVNCYLPNTNLIKEALIEVKPTVMCAVPRFYEKMFSAIHEKVSRAPTHRKVMFTWAVNMGAKMSACQQESRKPSWILKQSHKIADKLVLSKLRLVLGGNINFMPCGGAKLDVTIGRFFHALGVNVKLGYGMTETTATISCWEDGKFHPDSVGTVMPGAEVKIGENDEILVRGRMVMKGYYNKPEETASNFTEDGFLKTGDAGEFDVNGNLYITDRIKDLMKTSGGKYIAPQVIEGVIGKDHFIEQIAVIADTRKFVSALIVPCYDALEDYAKELNIAYRDRMELAKNSQIVEMLEKRVANLQKELARFEQVKKFTLLSKEFSMDKGELTPTQKLRRKEINARYQAEIDEMYNENKDK
ncbi:AMP-dependent synthetase/ligase [Vibrio splendidus]|nr:long-chain fatty acid--CoA ligase [Vibrio splendidus]MCC4883206.1 long-chain fatty acid--CoA ligase [Vibrio splendidus]